MRDQPQDDLLESIGGSSMPPEKEAPMEPSQGGSTGEEAPPPPASGTGKKPSPAGKPASVYRYLLVLFGAAFVLLLLAYFIQQRSSETTISDLRDSMNLSRAELMKEIDGLKEEKAALEEETVRLQEERGDLEKRLEELQKQYADTALSSAAQEKELQSWLAFWELEADFLAKNYEACAQSLQILAESASPLLPDSDSAQQRMRAIYEALLDLGYLTEDDPVGALFGAPEAADPE